MELTNHYKRLYHSQPAVLNQKFTKKRPTAPLTRGRYLRAAPAQRARVRWRGAGMRQALRRSCRGCHAATLGQAATAQTDQSTDSWPSTNVLYTFGDIFLTIRLILFSLCGNRKPVVRNVIKNIIFIWLPEDRRPYPGAKTMSSLRQHYRM